MKESEKKTKVGFILSCREEKALKLNDAYYQSIFKELMNTDDYEVNIEFDFYYNK